ncbi:MAG: class I SAM-dependent methyltransferase [bacterium]
MSRAERLKWERIYGTPDAVHGLEPTAFLVDAVRFVPPGRALVVAMGEGRNAAFLARAGFRVEGIDVSLAAVRKATERVRREGGNLVGVVADLDDFPLREARYDLVCVSNFLDRSLFEPIARAIRPGGALVWETFTRIHAAFGSPRSPAYLLDPGELRTRFADFELCRYRERILERDGKRRAVASLFATRQRNGTADGVMYRP